MVENIQYVKCLYWPGYSHKTGRIYKVINGRVGCEKEGTPTSYALYNKQFLLVTLEEYNLQEGIISNNIINNYEI